MPLNNETIRAVLQFIYKHKSRDGLWTFIKDYFKVEIPRLRICTDHDAPFDFVCAVFFQEYEDIIAVANRNGGKTIDFSILDVLNSYVHDECETSTIGAIEMQAKRCYRYVKYWNQRVRILSEMVRSSLQSSTEYKNGSIIEILIGTLAGVNAPHPQKVFFDEIELADWIVLQEAFSMAKSKGEIKAQTILTSSRKFAYGPMERLLAEADERGFKVFRWCIMETVEKHDPVECATTKFGTYCQNRCQIVEGFYSFSDAKKKCMKLDQDTWESQWMSWKPMSKGLVYPNYAPTIHLRDIEPDLSLPLELSEDFGFAPGHADVVGFWQVSLTGQKRLIDAIWVEGKLDDEIIEMVEDKLVELGFVLKRFAEKKDRAIHRHQFNDKVKAWYCPPEEPSKISIRRRLGYNIITCTDPELRKIRTGIPSIRKDFADINLIISKKCKEVSAEFEKYPNKKRGDGTYLDEPDKKYDNGPDMVRYFYINRFPPADSGTFTRNERDADDETYTGGIRDAIF